jgi:hypothetical protein
MMPAAYCVAKPAGNAVNMRLCAQSLSCAIAEFSGR